MKRKFVLPAVLALTVLTTGLLAGTIKAQATYPIIIERLADKFNLDKSEIQRVFDEVKDEKSAERYASWVERLDDLVAEEKLTHEQKQALLDKHEEIESTLEELKGLDQDERKVAIGQLHKEVHEWVRENGLNGVPFVFFKRHLGPGYGLKGEF